MSKEPKMIIYDKRQSLLESIISDFATFGFMALCIYLSHGSRMWTFLLGSLFLMFISSKVAGNYLNRSKKIYTKADAIAWANSLEESP